MTEPFMLKKKILHLKLASLKVFYKIVNERFVGGRFFRLGNVFLQGGLFSGIFF